MKTILLVDDEFSLVDSLKEILSWHGYVVFTAGNGEEALALMPGVHPDLILVDYMMPVMNGVQMVTALRREHGYERLPVIMMTASPPTHLEASGLWNLVLRKPFELDELLDAIQRVARNAA